MISEIDKIIRESLTAFVEDVFKRKWRGREYEAVSLYAFGFLQPLFRPNTALTDPTQIALEGTVPGVMGLNPKGRVCKDLVLWPKPMMTCWDEKWKISNMPISIMEWKVFRLANRKAKMSAYDITWLKKFSESKPNFVGYAISLDLLNRDFRLCTTRTYDGSATHEWLIL
jgi:hypothetical protein